MSLSFDTIFLTIYASFGVNLLVILFTIHAALARQKLSKTLRTPAAQSLQTPDESRLTMYLLNKTLLLLLIGTASIFTISFLHKAPDNTIPYEALYLNTAVQLIAMPLIIALLLKARVVRSKLKIFIQYQASKAPAIR